MALGVAVSLSGSPALMALATGIEPLGTIFINAIRMTVVPLVVGSLVVGVAAAPDPRTIGRIGVRALVLFLVTLLAGAIYAAVVTPPLMAVLPIDAAARAAMSHGASDAANAALESAHKIPTFAQWLVDLVPVNPVKAAADGAMLPLIVFSLVLGLAAARLAPERRETLIRVFDGLASASLVLVRWVLVAAPIGVFALALPLAARMGATAAGAVAYYIALVVGLSTLFALAVLYPLGAIGGRVSFRTFAQLALPPQAVALSARSSLAALPAMIESAKRIGLREEIASFLLPLAASMYRVGGAIGQVIGVVFLAHLYGVALGATDLATIVLTVVLTTFSVPGIPAGSMLIMAPVLMAANIPIAGLGILLGVDTIPDMFRTATNITADMAAAVVLGRAHPDRDSR